MFDAGLFLKRASRNYCTNYIAMMTQIGGGAVIINESHLFMNDLRISFAYKVNKVPSLLCSRNIPMVVYSVP